MILLTRKFNPLSYSKSKCIVKNKNYENLSFFFNFSEKPFLKIFNTDYVNSGSGNYLVRYSFGAALNFTTAGGAYAAFEFNDNGPWEGDTGATSYFAARNTTTSKEAWVAVEYNDAANTLDLISFAVADASDNITAGQTVVPEPSETAALMVLAAGSAAIYRKRQRKKA